MYHIKVFKNVCSKFKLQLLRYAAGQVSGVTQARLRSGGKKVHYLSSLVIHTVVGKGVDIMEVEEAEELLEVPVVGEERASQTRQAGVG